MLLSLYVTQAFASDSPNHGDIKFIGYDDWKCFEDVLIPFSKLTPPGKDVVVKCTCHLLRKKTNCYLGSEIMKNPFCWRTYIDRYGGTLYYKVFQRINGIEGWDDKSYYRKFPLAKCDIRLKYFKREFERLKKAMTNVKK